MTLLNPDLLRIGLGLTLLALVGLWAHAGRRRRLAEFLGGRRAVDRLSPSDLLRLRLERAVLVAVGGFAAALAAAEPRLTASTIDTDPPGPPPKSVVLAIDVSASMQAGDVPPNRLARAVQVAGELVEGIGEEHRIGLLLFAGTGYPLAPPTRDHGAVRFLLSGVVPTVASAQDPGSLVSVGLSEGIALLEHVPATGGEGDEVAGALPGADRTADSLVAEGAPPAGTEPAGTPGPALLAAVPAGERILVLIGDGEAGEPDEVVVEAITAAGEAGITVYTVGVGTAIGAGMIMPEGRYQLSRAIVDRNGERGTSHLEEARLRQIAASGGGTYTDANDVAGLRQLGSTLRDPGTPSRVDTPEALPFWVRYDLVLVLGGVALSLILLESLIDAVPLGFSPRRRWTAQSGGAPSRQWLSRDARETP